MNYWKNRLVAGVNTEALEMPKPSSVRVIEEGTSTALSDLFNGLVSFQNRNGCMRFFRIAKRTSAGSIHDLLENLRD